MNAAPQLSVVVLTHNAFAEKSGCVRHTLTALGAQQKVRFETILVDNKSMENDQQQLRQVVASNALQPLDITLEQVEHTIGEARNHGARLARSDTIVFLDDDAILMQSDALAQVRHLADLHSHGYGAQRLWTPSPPWFDAHQTSILQALERADFSCLSDHVGDPPFPTDEERIFFGRSFPGHFGFVHRRLFSQIGGFPPGFHGYGCEDNAFALMCFLQDSSFGWMGELQVAHVDHPVPARYAVEHLQMVAAYRRFLADRSLYNFRIEFLLCGQTDLRMDQILIGLEASDGQDQQQP